MIDGLLPAIEAFRAILRARYPERVDLLLIDSYRWLHDRQRMPDGPFGQAIRIEEDKPAYEALDLIRDGIARGNIRLRGELDGAMPADIEISHRQRGDLDVFEAKFTVDDKDYRHVYVYAEDLPLPRDGADQQQQIPQMHYPGDAALIEEGIRMVANGMKYRAIARELAPRADGPNTDLASKEDRLRKAIAAEHKRRLGDR